MGSLIELGRELSSGWTNGVRSRAASDAGSGPAHSFGPAVESRRLFFAVRAVRSFDTSSVQYACVDDAGEVVVDTAAEPAGLATWERQARLASLCDGAELIAHHRALLSGLLPRTAAEGAAGVACAAQAFEAFARRQGLHPASRRKLRLDDCLGFIGLPPVEGEAAVLQALSIRLLWRWMETAH